MATNHIKCVPPTILNKYYISQSKGGYSLNQVRDSRTGYVLPNCTGYASGKFNEEYNRLMKLEPHLEFDFFRFDAQNFWWQVTNTNSKHYNELPYGFDPKVGGIMVWDDAKKIGHVAIVDEILNDYQVRIAQSSYSGREFSTEVISLKDGSWYWGNGYKYLGCIYNPAVKKIVAPNPVKRDKTKHQVYISKSTLRVRTAPSLSAEVVGFAPIGYYDFVQKVNSIDGYDWYQIDDYCWCAGVTGTLTEMPCIEPGVECMIDPIENIRESYKNFAYTTKWRVEIVYNNGRALVKNVSNGVFQNVSINNLII